MNKEFQKGVSGWVLLAVVIITFAINLAFIFGANSSNPQTVTNPQPSITAAVNK